MDGVNETKISQIRQGRNVSILLAGMTAFSSVLCWWTGKMWMSGAGFGAAWFLVIDAIRRHRNLIRSDQLF